MKKNKPTSLIEESFAYGTYMLMNLIVSPPKPFYVGEGLIDTRPYAHFIEADSLSIAQTAKHDMIRKNREAGFSDNEMVKIVVANVPKAAGLYFEKKLIDAIGLENLTNKVDGWKESSTGSFDFEFGSDGYNSYLDSIIENNKFSVKNGGHSILAKRDVVNLKISQIDLNGSILVYESIEDLAALQIIKGNLTNVMYYSESKEKTYDASLKYNIPTISTLKAVTTRFDNLIGTYKELSSRSSKKEVNTLLGCANTVVMLSGISYINNSDDMSYARLNKVFIGDNGGFVWFNKEESKYSSLLAVSVYKKDSTNTFSVINTKNSEDIWIYNNGQKIGNLPCAPKFKDLIENYKKFTLAKNPEYFKNKEKFTRNYIVLDGKNKGNNKVVKDFFLSDLEQKKYLFVNLSSRISANSDSPLDIIGGSRFYTGAVIRHESNGMEFDGKAWVAFYNEEERERFKKFMSYPAVAFISALLSGLGGGGGEAFCREVRTMDSDLSEEEVNKLLGIDDRMLEEIKHMQSKGHYYDGVNALIK